MSEELDIPGDALLTDLAHGMPVTWCNPPVSTAAAGLEHAGLPSGLVDDAAARLERFAPWIAQTFPETAAAHGLIESPLQDAPRVQRELGIGQGRLLLKRDDILPVSGSVKARGGVHEVLEYAESLAVRAGLLPGPAETLRAADPTPVTLGPKHGSASGDSVGAAVDHHAAASWGPGRSSTGGDVAGAPTDHASAAGRGGDRSPAGSVAGDGIDEAPDYRVFSSGLMRELLGGHRIVVGSTGNLGLSIGIISTALGLRATVHMSSHAQQWKKDLLRRRRVEVVEHRSNYTEAVAAGRRAAEEDESVHFVDDEHSLSLFAGYAVAGRRLAGQLVESGVVVDREHPLFVYLPCGIGGAPGGVAYGLKREFGDAVHCVFVEPTEAPCMLLGVYTGRHDRVGVEELGLTTRTVADGLAVGRPSGFVGRAVEGLVDGYLTVTDNEMLSLVGALHASEGIDVEPSAAAALAGPVRVAGQHEYRERVGVTEERLNRATHIAWLTGGGMLPPEVFGGYLRAVG